MKRLLKKDLINLEIKNLIRNRVKNLRDKVSKSQRKRLSDLIGRHLRNDESYKKARCIMFYLTHQSEVQTEDMIKRAWEDKKTVVLPCCDLSSKTLKALNISSFSQCKKKNRYGILEPDIKISSLVPKRKIDLVIVPGIAFDFYGYRIGYGKGYYDKWLKNFTIKKRIGLSFSFQLVDFIPKESHDIPVGKIVTENGVIDVKETPEKSLSFQKIKDFNLTKSSYDS